MAQKRFRLAAVLKHRQRIEDNVKREPGKLQRELIHEQEILQAQYQEDTRTRQEVTCREREGIQASERFLYQVYLHRLTEAIGRQKLIINRLQESVTEKRDEILEARKNKKVFDKKVPIC